MTRRTGRQRIAAQAAAWGYHRRARARRLRAVGIALAVITAAGVVAATDTTAWINRATPTNARFLKESLG